MTSKATKHLKPARRTRAKAAAIAAAAPRPAPAPAPARAPAAPASPTNPSAPTWATRTIPLRALVPWPRNPRKINAAQSERLLGSFTEFGQVELVAVGPNGEVYNGHQRLKVLAAKHGLDYQIEARVCSRELTELEREKLTIYLHRGAAGEFDLEILLKEFDPIKLNEWGMPDLNMPDIAEDEWKGMPEFDGTPRSHARVSVLFTCDEDVAAFAALVQQPVTAETTSIWFPARARTDLSSEQWAGAAADADVQESAE